MDAGPGSPRASQQTGCKHRHRRWESTTGGQQIDYGLGANALMHRRLPADWLQMRMPMLALHHRMPADWLQIQVRCLDCTAGGWRLGCRHVCRCLECTAEGRRIGCRYEADAWSAPPDAGGLTAAVGADAWRALPTTCRLMQIRVPMPGVHRGCRRIACRYGRRCSEGATGDRQIGCRH